MSVIKKSHFNQDSENNVLNF